MRRAHFPFLKTIDEFDFTNGRQRQVLPTYTHPHVLVIDEVGDLGDGPDAANVLFAQ